MQSSSRFERIKLRKTALTIRTPVNGEFGEEAAQRNPDRLRTAVEDLKDEDSSEWTSLSPSDFSTPKLAGMEVSPAPSTPRTTPPRPHAASRALCWCMVGVQPARGRALPPDSIHAQRSQGLPPAAQASTSRPTAGWRTVQLGS